jgi:hypothetical protein
VPDLSPSGTKIDLDALRTNPLGLTGRGTFGRGNGLDMLVDATASLFVANDSSKCVQQFKLDEQLSGKDHKLVPTMQHAR